MICDHMQSLSPLKPIDLTRFEVLYGSFRGSGAGELECVFSQHLIEMMLLPASAVPYITSAAVEIGLKRRLTANRPTQITWNLEQQKMSLSNRQRQMKQRR